MPAPVHVTDPEDPRLAPYLALTDPALRSGIELGQGIFVAEGANVLRRVIGTHHEIVSVLVTPHQFDVLSADLARVAAPVYVAEREVIATAAGFDVHRGVLAAVVRPPALGLDDVLHRADGAPLVVLEGLNDQENLGAIIRSARALGAGGLLLDPRSTDPLYRRTVRVSMGEAMFVPTHRASAWPGALADLQAAGVTVAALTPAPDALDAFRWDPPERVALLAGAEGPGLSPAAQQAADVRLRIPISPTVDSLNVGHAVAIALALVAAHRSRSTDPRRGPPTTR